MKEELWIQQLPVPIQKPLLWAYNVKSNPSKRLSAVRFSVYQILKFSCCIFLPQMISSIKDPKNLDAKLLTQISKSMTAIKAPNFIDWQILFEIFVKRYKELKISFPYESDFKFLEKLVKEKKERNIKILKNNKISDIDLFRELRNTIAHDGVPDEKMDLEDLSYYLPILEDMINIYFKNWMKDIIVVCSNDCKVGAVKSANKISKVCSGLGFGDTYCEDEEISTYVLCKDKFIKVYPWIFYHDSENISKGIIDGFFKYKLAGDYLNVIYLDANRRNLLRYEDDWIFQYEKPSDMLLKIFNTWKLSWEMNKEKTSFYNLKDPVDYNTGETVSLMIDLKKYIPELYIERRKIDSELAQFCFGQQYDAKFRAVHIGGEYGLGKSALLSHLADLYLQDRFSDLTSMYNNNHVLFYLRCDGMNVESDNQTEDKLFKYAAPMLGVVRNNNGFRSFSDFFNHLEQHISRDHQEYRFVILIDSINESSNPQYLLENVLKLIVRSRKYDWLRIVFSIRSNYLEALLLNREIGSGHEKNPFADAQDYLAPCPWIQDSKEWKIPPLSIMEARQLFDNYQKMKLGLSIDSFDSLKPLWEREDGVLRNPLLINFFMHASNGKNVELLNTKEAVFSAWLNYKFQKQDALWRRVKCIVSWLIQENKFYFDEVDIFSYREEFSKNSNYSILDPIELCISEGIMTKYSKNNQIIVQFSFEALGALLYSKFLYEGLLEYNTEWFSKILNLNKKKNFRSNSLLSLGLTFLFRKLLRNKNYKLFVSTLNLHVHIDDYIEKCIENYFLHSTDTIPKKNKVLNCLLVHADKPTQCLVINSLFPRELKINQSVSRQRYKTILFALNKFERFYSRKDQFSFYHLICAKFQKAKLTMLNGKFLDLLKAKILLEECIAYHSEFEKILFARKKVINLFENNEKSDDDCKDEDEVVFHMVDEWRISYSITMIFMKYIELLFKLNSELYSKEIRDCSYKLLDCSDLNTKYNFSDEDGHMAYLLQVISLYLDYSELSDTDNINICLKNLENNLDFKDLNKLSYVELLNLSIKCYKLSHIYWNFRNFNKTMFYGMKSLRILNLLPDFDLEMTEKNLLIFWYKINNFVPTESQISDDFKDDEYQTQEMYRDYYRSNAKIFIEDKYSNLFLTLYMLGDVFLKVYDQPLHLKALNYFKKSEVVFNQRSLYISQNNFINFIDLNFRISESLYELKTINSLEESLSYIFKNINYLFKLEFNYSIKIKIIKSHLLLTKICFEFHDKELFNKVLNSLKICFDILYRSIDFLTLDLFCKLINEYELICDNLNIEYNSYKKYDRIKDLILRSKINPVFPPALLN